MPGTQLDAQCSKPAPRRDIGLVIDIRDDDLIAGGQVRSERPGQP